jgi:hypothetical protein
MAASGANIAAAAVCLQHKVPPAPPRRPAGTCPTAAPHHHRNPSLFIATHLQAFGGVMVHQQAIRDDSLRCKAIHPLPSGVDCSRAVQRLGAGWAQGWGWLSAAAVVPTEPAS